MALSRIGCRGNGTPGVIENRPDFIGQLFQGERFLKKVAFDIRYVVI
jgi:hypothetical protein